MAATAWKRGWEKLARRRRARRFGSRRMMGRCWGPKKRRASARMPYLSSVQCVCRSHCFFCSHQIAWSDQSCLRLISSTIFRSTPPMCDSPVTRRVTDSASGSSSPTNTRSSQDESM